MLYKCLKQNKSIIIKWSSGLLIATIVFGFFAPFQLIFAETQEENFSGVTITSSTVDEFEITTVEDTENDIIDISTLSLVISSSTTDIVTSTVINEDPSSNTGTMTIESGSTATLSITATVGTTTEFFVSDRSFTINGINLSQ